MPRFSPHLIILLLFHLPLLSADTIHFTDGTSLHGTLLKQTAGFVEIEITRDSDTAIRRIPPSTIQSLHFDDSSATLETQALKRARFLGLLSPTDEAILTAWLAQLLTEDRSLEALAYAKKWQFSATHSTTQHNLSIISIQAATQLNHPDEAATHARTLLKTFPDTTHAPLAWATIAQHYANQNKWPETLWSALQPIAKNNPTSPHFQTCLNLAAQAYQHLGYPDHATALLSPNSNHTHLPHLPLILLTDSPKTFASLPSSTHLLNP